MARALCLPAVRLALPAYFLQPLHNQPPADARRRYRITCRDAVHFGARVWGQAQHAGPTQFPIGAAALPAVSSRCAIEQSAPAFQMVRNLLPLYLISALAGRDL